MSGIHQAAILTGGRGTRLGSLTDDTAKPMLLVGGKPFLEYVVEYLQRFNIRRILFCTGYQSAQIEQYFRGRNLRGCEIEFSVEPSPAGTGGALLNARHLLEEAFYVLNGDTFFELDLPMLSALLFSKNREFWATIGLRLVNDVQRYGQVILEGDQIVSFTEKGQSGSGLISGGIYCLRKEALQVLPAAPCSLEKDLFPKLAAMGRIGGFRADGYFTDIGLPDTLDRAQIEVPSHFSRQLRQAGPPLV
jgi:D-glycero-D-manno-heptose 1,7-bisphosphate phosphatase